jgi:asparagine synthase (glutamine-hydrolysing)
MCGIFGGFAPRLPPASQIRRALDAIRHRGPDDEGYLLADIPRSRVSALCGRDSHPEVRADLADVETADAGQFQLALGHRRLSILDVSAKGHQPFGSEDGALWITYNGEIFNYRELRNELKACGYRFRSETDTEVILAAYREWGEAFVHRLNGQWAFCIYERDGKRLFCSRDRFGIKPFYYWYDGQRLVFASELKAFFELPFIPRRINEAALTDFVLFQRLEHRQESLFEGVHQLFPGHNMVFDLETARLEKRRYYAPPLNDETGRYSHRQALRYADDIRDLFVDAVKLRLVSDVPVGSCLSGGLDSSFIVAVIHRLLKDGSVDRRAIRQRQKTFTASFDDPAVDEKPYVEKILRHTAVDGYFDYPAPENLWRDIDRLLHFQDGLCFGTNVYAGWQVMRLASRHVKVVINGQGSDEIFGGYARRYDPCHLAFLARARRFRAARDFLVQKYRVHGMKNGTPHLLKNAVFASLPDGFKSRYLKAKMKARFEFLGHFVGPGRTAADFPLYFPGPQISLNHQLWRDQTRSYLPMLLRYDDRNASAVSIENRVPFLDHRLVAYVNRIPSIYKIYNGWNKWLLRLAMQGMLPDDIVWRKDKNGFGTPEKKWLARADSPAHPMMRRYGIKRRGNHLWSCLAVDRLMHGQWGTHAAET